MQPIVYMYIQPDWILSNSAKQLFAWYSMQTFVRVVNVTSTLTKLKICSLKV